MLVHFDFTSGVPLYRQLRDQIVLGLAEGRLAPGEKLPPVRVLAEESGVNTMTVSSRPRAICAPTGAAGAF